jgi:murein DD-endopeptidase MepM/ murein hydrolase activator NlpD
VRRFTIAVVIAALSAGLCLMPGTGHAEGHTQLPDDLIHLHRVIKDLEAARATFVALDGARVAMVRQMSEENLRSGSVETELFKELARDLPPVRDRARAARRTLDRLRRMADRLRSEISYRRSLLFPYCPVDQPVEFVDDFGVISLRGGIHVHQGVDMLAPYGTPIRAPFDGIAVTATNLPGGLAVKVFGPNGFLYNAHLSAFAKLGKVKGGDIIGYVGNSGDAQFTHPHDHIEWHPGGGGAVDPYPYLISSCT